MRKTTDPCEKKNKKNTTLTHKGTLRTLFKFYERTCLQYIYIYINLT